MIFEIAAFLVIFILRFDTFLSISACLCFKYWMSMFAIGAGSPLAPRSKNSGAVHAPGLLNEGTAEALAQVEQLQLE